MIQKTIVECCIMLDGGAGAKEQKHKEQKWSLEMSYVRNHRVFSVAL